MKMINPFPKNFLLSHRRLLPFVAALILAGIAWAGNSVRGHGDCAGTIGLKKIGDNKMEVQIDTIGNITHLGRSTVQLHSIADFSGPVPVPVPPSLGVVTAANGDTITFLLKWKAQAVDSGIFEVAGTFEVTGGTGRFLGATGDGKYLGHIDTMTHKVKAEIDGLLVR